MEPITLAMGLAQFAPQIIKWVTGSEKAADAASSVIEIAKGVTGKSDGESALKAIQADPNLALQYRTVIINNETDLDKAYLLDKQNARLMQMTALGQEDKLSKQFIYWFSGGWSIFAMIYFACVTFIEVPPAGQRIADTILGVLIGSILGSIFQFFYGSNRQSQTKDTTIANLSK